MSNEMTPNLSLPYIMAAQAQKHVTHNEAIRALDAILQISVLDKDLATPPSSPTDGRRYIVATGATGAWAGHAGAIAAYQDGAWAFYTPREGWLAWVADEDLIYSFNGSAWVAAAVASINPAPMVGVNTTADTTNRLAVKSNACLFSHDDVTPGSGDMRVVYNKKTAANTASFLFQDAYSGRAEVGITGNDNLSVKVSADGSTWRTPLTVKASNGYVGIGSATDPQEALHIAGSSPSFTVENTNGAQFATSAFSLKGPSALGAAAQTRFLHQVASADGTQAQFTGSYYNHAGAWQGNLLMYMYQTATWLFATNNVGRLLIDSSGATKPAADNAYSLGASGFRWSQIWAANGTINTSDARDKIVSGDLSAFASGMVDAVSPILFKWRVGGNTVIEDGFDVVDAPGEPEPRKAPRHRIAPREGRRMHTGFRAQDLKAAMDAAGVDFGGWGLDDDNDPDSRQWIRPDQLVAVLWEALRETRVRLAALERAT